jgi:hypothetical protein
VNEAQRGQPPQSAPRVYPAFVVGPEAQRRWRLVSYAALAVYELHDRGKLESWDRLLTERTRRTFFDSSEETGEGDLRPDQLSRLESLGLL